MESVFVVCLSSEQEYFDQNRNFGSILPISLQQIASEKNHTVHQNKLKKRYTLIPMTIHIVKYLGGDIVKLVDFARFVFFHSLPYSLL